MFGVLSTLLISLGVLCAVWRFVPRLREGADPAEGLGLSGLVGLGLAGLLVLLIGLVPAGLRFAPWVVHTVAAISLVFAISKIRQAFFFKRPEGWPLAALVAILLAVLFALVGALGPSDMNDWDSIAYHLAVPKIWLEHGRIDYIPYIHHSNFPGAIDNLFILGLTFGGEAAAKMFSVVIFILGILSLFGLTRRRYGEKAAWLAALAFVAIPCVLWESGTAYIDVGHGLFAGLGILYAAEAFEKRSLGPEVIRAAVCLAFACASKYTGLQTLFACSALIVGAGFGSRAQESPAGNSKGFVLKSLVSFAVAAAVLAGPWYVRNVVNTGNPVYPFFYEVFDGKNWDAFSAKIYKEEQKTFGAGNQATDLGAAVLGLAYQPGRYTNPAPTAGGGMPTGALGVVVVAAWLVWLLSGRLRRFEASVMIVTGISLAMWFVLSQQSRYLVTLGIPACVLAGAALERLRVGPILAALTALQAAYSLYVSKVFHVDPKLPVVLGRVSRDDYLAQSVGFYEASKLINEVVPKDGRVALYDEVFGYFLDLPYFWANPGHSTLISYDQISDGPQLAEELRRLGFTHVYMNLSVGIAFPNREARDTWLQAAHLDPNGRWQPFSPADRDQAFADLRTKWRHLVAEASAMRKLTPVPSQIRGGILFEISK